MTDDILSSPEATVEVYRCSDPECGEELLSWDEEEYVAMVEAGDDEFFACPACGKDGTIEKATVTLRERIDQFNEAVDRVIDAALLIHERVPSLQPKAEEMVAMADAQIKALAPGGGGVRSAYVVDAVGEARWEVSRY